MRRIPILLLTVFFVICSVLSFAANKPTFSSGLSTGNSAGEYANQRLGSKSALKSHILTPASSGGKVQMHSLNGQNPFSASVSAPSGKKILEILIHPSSTGDLSPVYVYENTGSGDKYNYSYTIPFAVSGICANGVVRCDPGTWSHCKYYRWITNSNGDVLLQEQLSTDFGGCYCINDSCGYNLASNNLSIVLKDIGGGAVGAVMASGNYKMTVSGVNVNSADIIYYGQIIKDTDAPQPSNYSSPDTSQYEWQTGSTNPSSYYSGTNGGYLFAAAGSTENGEKTNPDSMYNLIATSGETQKNPIEQKTCYIKRIVDITKHINNYYTGVDGDGTKFDTSQCADIDMCQTNNGTRTCRCKLPPTGGGYCGCGYSFNYNINGKWEFSAYSPDDYNFIIKINGKTYKTTGGCYTTGGTNPYSGTYSGVTNGSIFAAIGNGGGCNGHPTASFYAFIQRKAWDTVSSYIDDQCKAYENNDNCTLRDEWVDGIRTWNNYASTGLTPVGQVCKTFNGWTSHTFCYNWWTKERVYICKTKGYNFDKAKQRATTIINSTADANVMSTSTLGSVNYQDYRSDNGSWGYHNGSMTIPLAGSKQGCMFVCKVRVPVQDTQAYSGTNTSQYRSINSYAFDYRKCADNNGSYTCPYNSSKGETVVTNCQCIDEFAEAATIMNTLENAGKDIICSSGVRH